MSTNLAGKRNQSIELLRVLSMVLIIAGHYCYHGLKAVPELAGFDVATGKGLLDYVCMEFLWIISCMATNCYVMITGYFLAGRTAFRWKGIVKIWLQTVFYGWIACAALLIFGCEVSWKTLASASFPFITNQYWFITNYFALMLLAPFLSFVVNKLHKRSFQMLLLVKFLLSFHLLYGAVFAGPMSLQWFVFLYLLSSYIKLYEIPIGIEKRAGSLYLGLVLVLFLGALAYNGLKYWKEGSLFKLMSLGNDSFILFLSFLAFIYFLNLSMEHHRFLRWVSAFAPYTLGVYLIHECPMIKALGLWEFLLRDVQYWPTIVHCMLVVLSIFLLCLWVDILRCRLFVWLRIDSLANLLTKKLPSSL